MSNEHPTRRAARLASRKISERIRRTFDVEYMHGEWCGPQWREAAALDAELRSAPEFVALQESAARAPLYVQNAEG